MNTKNSTCLAIDVGSVAVSCIHLGPRGTILETAYRFHEGNPGATFCEIVASFSLPSRVHAVATSTTPDLFIGAVRFDSTVSYVRGARASFPRIGSLLIVGGERFGLVRFDEHGSYVGFHSNTSCAAGTGSFLDQQARRLELSGSAELSTLAERNRETIPTIASRCSVFAKTDIIHAQQEGYGLEEICDGLCRGLAKNVSDTIFTGTPPLKPVVFSGGVSQNRAVRTHLEHFAGAELVVHRYSHLFGALGAGWCLIDEADSAGWSAFETVEPSGIVHGDDAGKRYFFGPLRARESDSPSSAPTETYHFIPAATARDNPVEVEIFDLGRNPGPDTDTHRGHHPGKAHVFIGIDIGSTSTKAAVIDHEARVLAGFYVRTAGKPVLATQALFESIEDAQRRYDTPFSIRGVSTTGSGRAFIGRLIGADLVLDEISAHARAAYALDPGTDTIIEIGGQDSKFTTMNDGMVTFSQMNTVCAAGTGSFLEEQANRLGVPVTAYADAALGAAAPLTSDRCTVFMERDINAYIHKGYTTEEILAAAIFSVRENYLLKVASRGHIGTSITFQGATARNKALVAAFRDKLGKPIHVSPFCHITGALGAALNAYDEGIETSIFRGTGIWRSSLSVTTERCRYCANHCRILLTNVAGERVAYGFLCGRDYETHHFVDPDSKRFDMIKERRRAEKRIISGFVSNPGNDTLKRARVGIPESLHLAEDTAFWQVFLDALGIEAITSRNLAVPHGSGRQIAGAEFCTPMANFFAHSRALAREVGTLFIPLYLEDREISELDARTRKQETDMRLLCYYTQFAPSLVSNLEARLSGTRCIMPVLDPRKGEGSMLEELRRKLRPLLGEQIHREHVAAAYAKARTAHRELNDAYRSTFASRNVKQHPIDIVLFGRPYTILSPGANGRIPDIVRAKGFDAWYQDMLPLPVSITEDIDALIKTYHWNYASKILRYAELCAESERLYPILVTSFRCSPDSFLIDSFRMVFESRRKPYLILQLDEHDSSVGYETRIEAALRTFLNHHTRNLKGSSPGSSIPPRIFETSTKTELRSRTLLLPNWDSIASPLIAANLRWAGYDARLLEEDEVLIRESMRHNTGQCIPVSIILEEYAAYIRKHGLDPAKSVLWMGQSKWSCNIPMFGHYIKSHIDSFGAGFEKAQLYLGEVTYIDLSPPVAIRGYLAYLLGGMIRRMSCRIRPYETVPGATDLALKNAITLLESAFTGESNLEDAVESAAGLLEVVPTGAGKRRKVAIFGDFYVRDNDILNQDLIRYIERSGGEVVTTPYSVYMKIVSRAYFRQLLEDHKFKRYLTLRALLPVGELLETRYARYFDELGEELNAGNDPRFEAYLNTFNVSLHQGGESWENILKIFHLVQTHRDLSLFVQTNPAFCCPSLVTEAMSADIERVTGVPVVTLTYDGTGTFQNDLIAPYLKL